jgi:branched-chain amino acid transport system permease protein
MNDTVKTTALFGLVAVLILGTGFFQSWNSALGILNMGLISAIMAMGVNLQWGFAGLFNVGIMGFVGLGGLATVLVSMPPVPAAWASGGVNIWVALLVGALSLAAVILVRSRMPQGTCALS